MANHEIPVLLSELKNQFSTDMRKIETSDLVHADTVNPLFRQLLINDAYANAQMKDLEAGTTENDALQTEEKQMVNAVNEINRKLGDLTETVEEKVKKIEGKGLSSNDFTDEEKQKLSNLPDQVALDTTLDQKINKTDIVNDLVTGGTEKVLSAEQGKVLFQSVVDGKGKIATAINDLAGSNVANQNMTFEDFGVLLQSNDALSIMNLMKEKVQYLYYLEPQSAWGSNWSNILKSEILLTENLKIYDSIFILSKDPGNYWGSYVGVYISVRFNSGSETHIGLPREICKKIGSEHCYAIKAEDLIHFLHITLNYTTNSKESSYPKSLCIGWRNWDNTVNQSVFVIKK